MFTNSVSAFSYLGSNIRSRFVNRSIDLISTIIYKYTRIANRALIIITILILRPLTIININI